MILSRRAFLVGTSAMAGMATAGVASASDGTQPFRASDVVDMARDLSAGDFVMRDPVPQAWTDLSYEQYKSIWFRNDAALWGKTDRPFNVDFFHPGLYFPRTVQVFEVADGRAQMIPFSFKSFDKTDKVPELPVDDTLGFSGLRLRTEFDQPGIKNEFCVFQGASYFRAIGMDHIYGLSARGLALKTGDPMGEEFPEFTKFWLEAPEPGSDMIVVHALMDSPSVAGAFRFEITPGNTCVMDVQATLFPRTDLTHVGLGPLTSMFLFDATGRTRFDDFRPAVHDTDGLMIWNGAGEVLWRPLANPKQLQVSSFVDQNPRGFGLMQRSRQFGDFNDLEALYHKRPGVWVEPQGDWGDGAVTLVEIPSDKEIYDNIVAYWRPRTPLPARQEARFDYRLTWCTAAPVDTGLARVIDTATGASHAWSTHEDGRIVTVEFEDHPLLAQGPEGIVVHVASPHAVTTDGILQRNPETGGLRVAFSFDPGERSMAELRAQMFKDGQMVSEVWLYRWTA